ncbi:ArsR/SmtB family transcription factor [Bifidobacterium fermentum]|uniref:Metalloregulator ArsR/SmtB family transcription factor n=1 Tax=Bifidobacterium fermentum TaxID=3059035 RepID=A0AB39UC09_9BIFI
MIVESCSADDEHLAQVFKALSDPTRIAILRYLKRAGRGVTCGEVAAVIEMSKSTGSYHFKQLRDAGLTITRKESREKYVSINKETFDTWVSGFYNRL